uniref:Uncharacterized protein n=1 Tax=Mustela putorius furo TaxID=9669 RepID=M3YZ86_MUSPF
MGGFESGSSLHVNVAFWLYILFTMTILSVIFFSFFPIFSKVDEPIRKCHPLQNPGRETLREEEAGMRQDHSLTVKVVGDRTQEICPVTSV